MSGGPGASGQLPAGGGDHWEITDAGLPPTRVTPEQVLALITAGRVGFNSQIRRQSEAQRTRTVERAEFAYAFPYLNFPPPKKKTKSPNLGGFVALNTNLPRALAVARGFRADPATRNPCFWLSAVVDWISAPIVRRARLFQMWDGFWVAPIVESSYVKPDGWLNVYLVAFNLTASDQHRTLRLTDAEIPDAMKGNLSFALPPGHWAVHLVSVPANRRSGDFTVAFKTKSGGERAATAIAVGVLTLGSFVYAPGSSGFSLRYQIVTPELANTITRWETYAIEAAARRFDQAQAQAISVGPAGRISKETILQRFRPYLTPGLILGALQSKQPPPETIVASLIDRFLLESFGVVPADKVFLAG